MSTAKKYHDLFKKDHEEKQNNDKAKEAILKLRQLIGEKLKDPETAKKASAIIEQMLNEKK